MPLQACTYCDDFILIAETDTTELKDLQKALSAIKVWIVFQLCSCVLTP